MQYKICTHKDHEGERLLPVSKFSFHPGMKDGYQSICRACNLRLMRRRKKMLKRKKMQENGELPVKDI